MVVVSLVGSPVVDDEADLVVRAQHDRRAFAHLYRQCLPRSMAIATAGWGVRRQPRMPRAGSSPEPWLGEKLGDRRA
jgi:hypothetical protein